MAPPYTLLPGIVKSLYTCLDVLWPSECVACKQEGEWLCQTCMQSTKPPHFLMCPLCNEPTQPWLCCVSCQEGGLNGIWSRWLYRGAVRNLVHAYKYKGYISMADWLAEQIAPALRHISLTPTIVSAVPTTRAKIAKRGFNQSELLARTVAHQIGAPYRQFLTRHQHRKSQTKLSREERRANVLGQFQPKARVPPNTTIILIDDVLTTGATLSECARVLKENGAAQVWAVTIAKD